MKREEILNTIQNAKISARDKSLLYIIAYCGPKVREIKELKARDISADKDSITINFNKRSIRIEDKGARFTIANWASKVNMDSFDFPLFSSIKKNRELTGKPMSDVSINKILQSIFPGTNVRKFRRMFIDQVINQDILKKDMKEQIGVSSYTALLHYTDESK